MANLNEKNARLANKRRQTTRRRGILAVLACIVAIATASALMVPAISMTKGELTCGIEEHAHSDACYTQVLTCDLQEAEGHAHTDACYEKVLVCDEEEGDDHVHTDACYEKQLTCGLEESEGHAHSAACYEKQLTCSTPEHTHTDACYTHVQANDEKVVAKAAAEAEKSEATAKSEEPAKAEQSSKAADTAKSSSAATSKSSASASSAAASKDSAKKDEAKMPAVDFEKSIKRSNEPDIKVIVKAPEGAFPEGTTMEAKLIAANDVQSKVEAAIERETGEEAKVKSITAVDIVFKNKDGKEIEPAKKVEVKITSDEVRGIDKPVLVHVLDKAKDSSKGKSVDAEIVGGVKIVDDDATGAEDNTMKFESEAFSPYVIVELEDGDVDPETGARTINVSNEDAGYSITVNIPAEAGVPSDARLSVEELLQPGRAWTSHVDVLEEQMGAKISYARMFDITILDAADNEIQPAVPVEVKITLDDAADLSDSMTVAHFASEDEVEFVDANLSGDTVSFDAEGFSVYAVIDPGTGEYARAKVIFHGLDGSPVATYYVKNSDVLKNDPDLDPSQSYSYIDDIVVDPGVGGTVPEGQVFVGWSMDDLMDSDGERYADTDTYVGEDYTVETTPMTVERIREILVDMQFTEGDIVNIYPMVFKYYNVTYFGDKATGEIDTHVSLGTDTVYLLTTEDTASYTVKQSYSADSHQNFKGWKPTNDTSGHITTDVTLDPPNVYPNNTKVTLSGDVTLYVEAPRGNWLVYNANARGATFNAPQFYLSTESTVIAANATVENMERNGYTLEVRADGEPGWYTLKAEYYDEDGKISDVVPRDVDGYPIISNTYFEPFTFGEPLEDNTEIFAKWTPKDTANYTIIFHKQNVDRDDYVIAGSYVGSGRVGDPIPFTFVNNIDEDYVTDAGGTDRHYTGFCLNHSGTDTLGDLQKTTGYSSGTPIKETVEIPTITPEGDAVLNVYFDRIEYEFRFYYYRQNGNQYSYAQNSRNCQNDAQAQWGNVYNVATWSNFGNARPTQTYGDDLTDSVEGYTAHYFVLNAYYGQEISSMWPQYSELGTAGGNQAVSFVMMNGTGLKKKINTNGLGVGRGSDTIKGTIDIMDEMILGKTNDADGNFVVIRYNTRNEWRYHIFYEQVEGVDYSSYAVHDYEFEGKLYYEDHIYNSRSTNQDVDQQTAPQFNGYQYVGLSNRTSHVNQSGNAARWTTTESGTTCYNVRFYYDRDLQPITFYDGNYVTGNNNPGTTDHNRGNQLIREIDPDTGEYVEKDIVWVQHGAPVPDDVKNYTPIIQQGEEGYVFEGWYLDEACSPGMEANFTTVPVGGITVYAKWRQVRYRVFLHSEAFIIDPDTGQPAVDDEGNKIYDDSLYWGSSDQQMSFGIAYGGKVSLPDGARDEYEFLGWFLDEEGNELFTDSTQLNDETVPAVPEYNKETDYTDYLDKHGNVDEAQGVPYNSDEDRFWVTRKLDLYGKWRQVIFGAEGIAVEYDVGELGNEATKPTDSLLYKDKAGAIAQPACKPTDEEKYQFLYWVVQKYDQATGGFVDAVDGDGNPIECSPGDSFTCLLTWAQQTENEGSTPENPSYTYTMRLRAEYGLKKVATPTHIDWYQNYGDEERQEPVESEQNLQINESAPIVPALERDGYKFLGWARIPTDVSDSKTIDGVTDAKIITNEEAASYMYLTYHEDETEPYFTVKVDGEDVRVTHVAADEKLVYHDMYAVWERVYTVKVDKTVVSGNDDDKQIPFEFSASYTINNEDEETDSFTLKHDGEKEYKDMFPAGSTFSVTETPNEDFDTTVTAVYTDDQGTEHTIAVGEDPIEIQGDTVITVTNTSKKKTVRVYKVDDSTSAGPLANVGFTINNQTLTTGTDGYTGTIELQGGSYTLTESQALAAYAGLSDSVAVSVSATGVTVTPAEADAAKVSIAGPDAQGVYTIKVINTKKVVPIKIVKVDQTGKPLAGATFTSDLYSGSKTSTMVGDEAVIYQDNKVSLGNYTMTETEPPAGYNPVNTVKIAVSSEAGSSNIAVTAENATVDPIDIDKPELGYKVTIQNSNGQSLPNTGGTGTISFTLGGIALVVAAACVYGFGSRRNRERGSRG